MRIVVDKVALGEVFLRVFRFHPLSIIPTTIHIHLHLRVAVTGRTNGRSLQTFQKVKIVRKWRSMEYISRLAFKHSFLLIRTRMDYFVLSRDFSNLRYQITLDNHNCTAVRINSRYHLRDVTLFQFVTH
jgi:hypothetical protein